MDKDVIVLSDTESEPRVASPSRDSDLDMLEEINNLDLLGDLPEVNFESAVISHDSPDSGFSSQQVPKQKRFTKKKLENQETERKKQEAEQKKQEKAAKRQKIQQEKLEKQVEKLNKGCDKKEEFIRNCRAIIDEGLKDRGDLEVIGVKMTEGGASFRVSKNPIPNSVLWEKISTIHFLEKDEILSESMVIPQEKMLILLKWDQVVDMLYRSTFISKIEDFQERSPGITITVLIEGMENYFSYHKGRGKKKDYGSEFQHSKKISRMVLEETLVELQLVYGCMCHLVEDLEQMALMVFQFTKSLATITMKENKWKKFEEVESYVEKRDLVAFSKEGFGLKRLWERQLCQFPLCSLEIAQAICTVYSSPVQLIDAYDKCSEEEGEMLLKDIPIRRAAGPLSSVRRIGPELSKKVYTMFTSQEGAKLIGQV